MTYNRSVSRWDSTEDHRHFLTWTCQADNMAASDEDLQQFMAITSCDASMAASMLEVRCISVIHSSSLAASLPVLRGVSALGYALSHRGGRLPVCTRDAATWLVSSAGGPSGLLQIGNCTARRLQQGMWRQLWVYTLKHKREAGQEVEATLHQEQGLGLARICECCMNFAHMLVCIAPIAEQLRYPVRAAGPIKRAARQSSARQGARGAGPSCCMCFL